jgi:hypothetical protein
MINPTKLEIDKIYAKIDKIAKKGNDNYMEYHIYVDDLVKKGKYSFYKECIEYNYEYDISFMDIPSAKKESWKKILFRTNTTFQDFKTRLLKSKGMYQLGLFYYKEIPQTSIKVIDTTGKGCELSPVVEEGGVTSIKVLKNGTNYSNSASVVITGGTGTASATPIIKAGKIYLVNITATGSGHNQVFRYGTIVETDEFEVPITNKFSKDLYQRLIGNKTTYLTATKDGLTYSATFSNWNTEYSYDKNISNLYTQAVNYLIS